jgi:quercetin dioxygenase-like cupin family protein
MPYALHASESTEGRLFDVGVLTQRLVALDGPGGNASSDEVLYVLEGEGQIAIGGEEHRLRPGVAIFAAAGQDWTASGSARAVSVLVHEPEPSAGHEVRDLDAVEKGTATAGRQFVLGPDCPSATQFIGLVPPGRAPDHYHEYDEVIYVLEGEGELSIGGETEPIRAGSCIHLPRRLVHCLANTGERELRLLGVFRPAGSPAAAYYPDGTLAVVPNDNEE